LERAHEAVVVGAGAAGLAAAAELGRRGVRAVVLERGEGVGSSWRSRYEGLRLNTVRQLSGLRGMRLPRSTGRYPTREDFIAYLEAYARRHRIEVRLGVSVERVDRGEDGDWLVRTESGELAARHVVIATGWDCVPDLPAWPGQETFEGELLHSAALRRPADHAGRDVLVVGAGNSGVDVAGHLIAAGARVALSMRTAPNIFPRDWLGMPVGPGAVLLGKLPPAVADRMLRPVQRLMSGELTSYGIPNAPAGMFTRFRDEGVSPAVDDGFVDALKAGRTRVVGPIERFEGAEVVLRDGERLAPDAVICATGYRRGLEPLVGHLRVLDAHGAPLHPGGAPEHPAAPRLYFVGFTYRIARNIPLFSGQARRVAAAVARDRAAAGARPVPSAA
jgi:putative flavoprotein involved in K+ transport